METIQQQLQTIVTSIVDGTPLTDEFRLFLKPWTVYSEYAFWFRIIRDHMTVINSRLADVEFEYKRESAVLRDEADQLRMMAFNGDPNTDITPLTTNAVSLCKRVREFKHTILNRLLTSQIKIAVNPSTVSHMLNELQAFEVMLLNIQREGRLPLTPIMNEHELWISDMIGHLDIIKCDTDAIEKNYRKCVKKQKKVMMNLHHKVLEMINYIKHGATDFPALQVFTNQTQLETLIYLRIVGEIHMLSKSKMIVGCLDPEFLLHMLLEEIYYIFKLSMSQPGFNPCIQYPMTF